MRTAAAHLLATAHSNRLPARRVNKVLDVVGLWDVAGRRVIGFSSACVSVGEKTSHEHS